MTLELEDVSGGGVETVAVVSLDDASGAMTFSAFQPDLPLMAVEHLVREARRRLPLPGEQG